ncbi:hypothetical protein N7414_01250 [Pseudomonas sp. GD04087]|uniref:hypothetical protein n=1 Tax=unclassified Pseudomonas TaxID=196821 RepID=UPI00244A2A2E|nr:MULTISPECIES: hypothetical protein [unclassified Pseudomonas]MDH0287725.1 hypothetical protein [Pseudomonas sp. GD04087]MDH1050850.1 hypothetical protein [Pseudomonas sp. GD03903]MDH1999823.1 hypothetical protein [Pseudomonas sp. GD03691]
MPDVREEFEEWYIREFFDGDKDCAAAWMITDPVSGGYLMERPAQYLSVWQASRAALKVEMPDRKQFVEYYEGLEGGEFNWRKYLTAVTEALQQAGIKVKQP